MDGSGDCGDDVLKELYPDDDIPADLIGFLDDKVFLFQRKVWVLSDLYTCISADLELGPKRKERERGVLIWKVPNKSSLISDKNQSIGTVPSISSPQC